MNTGFASLFLRTSLALVLVLSLLLTDVISGAAALRCYVDIDATGSNSGSSWTDAYTDLQSALGGSPCTGIWVAEGTYKPTATTNRAISFVLKNGVRIYGGFAGTETLLTERDPAANLTVLSAEIGDPETSQDNSYHVVVGSHTNSTAVLDGFTLTAGYAEDYVGADSGGGIYNLGGSPTLANLIISGNYGRNGGGGISNLSSSPSLTNVTLSSNWSDIGGGGMYNYVYSNPRLLRVIFSDNWAGAGGGMYNEDHSSPRLVDVAFDNNSAGAGGGLYNRMNSSPTLRNVTFSSNMAEIGGGIENYYESEPILTNVTFSSNTAKKGGGMSIYYGSPRLTNVTFTNNSATYGGAIFLDFGGVPIIQNSILYGDTGREIFDAFEHHPTVTYSIVQGGYPGTGNLDADPRLGPLQKNGGFTRTQALRPGSPAIDNAANTGCPARDQRGIARPQDGNGDGNSVCDMGATESRVGIGSFRSRSGDDGWMLESVETSSIGGSMNTSAATFNLGDNAADRQFRAMLSFNTSGLPDNAVIRRATVQIKQQGLPVGTNPFGTHLALRLDIRKSFFGSTAGLEISDFQAGANLYNAATFNKIPSAGAWYSAVLSASAHPYINAKGITQFRLRFALDDNDDMSADYLKFFSGDYSADPTFRPALVVEYYAP